MNDDNYPRRALKVHETMRLLAFVAAICFVVLVLWVLGEIGS